jgi:hypothetical protein
MLREQTQLHATGADDIAAICSFLTTNEPKNRRLASAVPPHKSDMLAGIHLEREATQNVVRAIRLMNFGKAK